MHADEIQQLLKPERWPHPCQAIELRETHLSWVILTGDYAYKIKKPVQFEFADFSTSERRRQYCREELRLNRRLAPDLYLDVVEVVRRDDGIAVGMSGTVIEYAVRMRQFPSSALLSDLIANAVVPPALIDDLAEQVSRFHQAAAVAGDDTDYGTPERVIQPVRENFAALSRTLHDPWKSASDRIGRIVEQSLARLQPVFADRRRQGLIRECHGDLHLGNMFLDGDHVTVFDGIEFNDQFRWIDVISEIAFTVMDLQDRGRPDLGWRFLNRWLERFGDYQGAALLPFYICYRAMVRAKVDSLQAHQAGKKRPRLQYLAGEFHDYLKLAESWAAPAAGAVIMTSGPSGSGKTRHSQALIEQLPAIRIRSDVERRRLAGVDAVERTGSDLHSGIYSREMTDRTYERLLELSECIVKAGLPVVADATFLRQSRRDPFRRLANRLQVPFVILRFSAPQAILEQRIRRRLEDGADPSEASVEVLQRQLATEEPLTEQELTSTVCYTGEDNLVDAVRTRIGRST